MMTLKEFSDYFVRGDFYLVQLEGNELESESWCWLFYLSRGSISLMDSRIQLIKNISILKIYSDSTPNVYCEENIIISRVLFFRSMEMVNLCVDKWLKVRIISQEIPWGLSQRLIEYYRVLGLEDYFNRIYSSNLVKDIIRLWRDTLVISQRKLLVVSDKEIDILEDFRDFVIEKLMELEGDDKMRGIRIYEPDYSFL